MSDAVEVEAEVGSLLDGDEAMLAAITDDPALEVAQPVDDDIDRGVATNPVRARTGAVDPQPVVVATVAQLHKRADPLRALGSTAGRAGEEGRVDHGAVRLVGLDSGSDDCERVCGRGESASGQGAVIPACVHGGVSAGDPFQHGQVCGAVGHADLKHDGGALQGAMCAVEGFLAVTSPGGDRRDERLDPAVDEVAFADA